MIDENTRVVVQGMTGKEGTRSSEEMIKSGTNITCGVTPGKGGSQVHMLPIYDSVEEAKKKHDVNTSVIVVPPLMVLDAATEAIDAGIELIIIITENVPVKDAAWIVEYARTKGTTIIGPSSIGVLHTTYGALGSIRGTDKGFKQGNVGIISKSGGLCLETARALTKNGRGQSLIIGIGGDRIVGTSFADALKYYKREPNTRVVVAIGEVGGTFEHELADAMEGFSKPIVAYISGQFAELLPRNTVLGHAGAVVEEEFETVEEKKRVLKEAGITVVDYHHEIPEAVEQFL